MVNAAMATAMRPSRVKFSKLPARSDISTDGSDVGSGGGGVSLLNTSPTITLRSLHKKDDEPAHRFVSDKIETKATAITVNGVDDGADDIEQPIKLNPASTPFMPAPAVADDHGDDVAQLAVQPAAQPIVQATAQPVQQFTPQLSLTQQQNEHGANQSAPQHTQQQNKYGAGQSQPFVLPPSVVNMLPADDQNNGAGAYQVGPYHNGNVNGIANGINHNEATSMVPTYPQLHSSNQCILGHGYSWNNVAPANAPHAMPPMQQQMQMPPQQFAGAQGGQQQDLYGQIQAQKLGLQQMNGGPVYQQPAPTALPPMNSFPQVPVQNGINAQHSAYNLYNGNAHYGGNAQYNGQYPGNAQYTGMGAPIGLLTTSASQNNMLSPPTSAATSESQETFSTEPRNFAPRSTEPTTTGPPPPPQFSLPATPMPVQYQAQVLPQQIVPYQGQLQNGHSDPFTVAPIPEGIQPLQTNPTQASNALTLYSNPVPDHIKALRSAQLNKLTSGPTGRPTLEVALDPKTFPFIDSPRLAAAANHGVVKLKNIPFATKRAEIIAFLGRNSKVLNDNQEPVHIIMERVTSKTNDAYVEFMSMQAAITAVEKHQKTISGGRLSRLGDRPVEVELSSQAALMEDLFPLARGIKWHGASPEVLPDHPTEPWQRFKGFISDEEMTMLVKHVEVPQRSPFSRDCPQRPFECMISTIKKLPWFMTAFITVRQRHSVFKAALDLLRLLLQAIKDKKHEEHFTQQLLRRLYTAAMLCPGFSVSQKDDIAYMINLSDQQEREFNQPRFANCWTHIYTMAPKPGIPLDVLEWYIAIVREETQRAVNNLPLNVRSQIQQVGNYTDDYWGYFWHELGLPVGQPFDQMTLANLSTLEFQAIDRILRRAFSQ